MRGKSTQALSALMTLTLAGGCVQRTVTVRSDPPGALVYLNDQEIGRTPVTRQFLWYGTYDVELRMAGFESKKTTAAVIAPWWQWVPIDFVAEFLPLQDHHDLSFSLSPPQSQDVDPQALAESGQELQEQLESTRRSTTRPTTRPHHRKKQ